MQLLKKIAFNNIYVEKDITNELWDDK